MFLGYQNGKIKFYTETPLNKDFYALEKVEETTDEYILVNDEYVLKDEAYEAQQLEEAKQTKYTEANTGAKAYLESGSALYELTPTQHIEATDGNIGKLTAYALAFITGQLAVDEVVYWNTKEDETITLTQEQLTRALAGLGAVQAQVWNEKFPAYKAQIEACTTADEVNAIVIDYGAELPEASNEEVTIENQPVESVQETSL